MSQQAAMFATYDNPLILCDSADFDGSADYMARGAALTGIADSKSGTLSMWVRVDSGDGTTRRIFTNTTIQSAQVSILTDNKIYLICENAAGGVILQGVSTSTYTAGASWLHLMFSWNLAVAGSGRFYIDGASAGSFATYTDDTIAYEDSTDWAIGGTSGGLALFSGCLAEVWFAPGVYLDVSNAYYLYKFRSRTGKPVHLGTAGALPTGTAPIVYQRVANGAAVATFATNLGTGGNFSITGTLETGSTSPSD